MRTTLITDVTTNLPMLGAINLSGWTTYFCVSQPAGLSVTELNARLLTDADELAIPKILGLVHILDHHHELSQKVCIYAKKRKK
ncbi:uncharacterized protein H6S33_007509 [Morchella sextelata]|uniref:uncharacterized protein n=1 Tax=Morchella sextelata TaxID=1174677 RepID=UPI001D03AEA2|nr:uncharacterized protein H6S33_007509 [Morchella sextelata]KAH0603850.1 hypothetical protein H6S33_007509 [Morchella sextelata]